MFRINTLTKKAAVCITLYMVCIRTVTDVSSPIGCHGCLHWVQMNTTDAKSPTGAAVRSAHSAFDPTSTAHPQWRSTLIRSHCANNYAHTYHDG